MSYPFSLPFCIHPYSHHVIPHFSGSTTSVACAVRAPTALRTRRERSIAAPRATSRIRGWAPPGLYAKRGSTHTRDCPARSDYEVGTRAQLPGPPRCSTAVRCAALAHHAEETFDESAVLTHRATPRRVVPRGRALYDERGERGRRACASRDWPARRGYEVGDRARWGGVFALTLALGSRVPTLLALGFLRPDYDDGDRDRECSLRTDEEGGYARAWMGGDGEKERERGKGKRRRAEHDVREEGRPGRVRGCGVTLTQKLKHEDAGDAEALASCLGAFARPRLGGVVELEPHHCSTPLGPFEVVAGRTP
ncbi:hypothetical protein B0H13DRAFT_2668468 [Mycena leptocephala]|nr:hypothetical protein B0H13DRAFT_2668468 [Mycena leptocephala]